MSIENDLGRIATALENLVALASNGDAVKAATTKSAPAKTAPAKPAAKVEEPVTDAVDDFVTEDGVDDILEAAETEPEVTVTFGEVNKALFAALGAIKTAKGIDFAKKVSASFAAKYAGGKQPTAGNTDPATYSAFLAEIEKIAKLHGGV